MVNEQQLKNRSAIFRGTVFGLLSAVGYTAANICLRKVISADETWVSFVKALPTVLIVGPIALRRYASGQAFIPTWSVFRMLVVVSLIGQIIGNVGFQWSLGIVGLALAVPLTLGAMIVSSALFGWWFLREGVTTNMIFSAGILMTAICVLGLGANKAHESLRQERTSQVIEETGKYAVTGTNKTVWGVVVVCLAGLAYSALGTGIRHATSTGTALSSVLTLCGVCGAASLGAIVLFKFGRFPIASTSSSELTYMILAGVFNAGAFFALVYALKLTPLFFVNVLNTTQAAMAAVAGVVVFQEEPTLTMCAGLALTAVGMLLMRGRKRGDAVSTANRGPACE